MTEAVRRAEAMLRDACGGRIRAAFPMAPLTTLRVGGPADLFLELSTAEDLGVVGAVVRETSIPVIVIGKGSNLLVSDRGFRGLVVRLSGAFRWAARDDVRLSAGGAMPLPALAGVALSHGLAGLEWGIAIPASFGGAVRMNAGAHGCELAEVLETIDVFALERGDTMSIPASEAGFRYRGSALPASAVVTGARIRLRPGGRADIRARMDEIREWRRVHQPLAEPNCGSVFKNPPGDRAARLIDEGGLKGMAVGGASVSTKHANFIVTSEGARAADVVDLIRVVQEAVHDRHGVLLEPEVHLVGEFDRVPL